MTAYEKYNEIKTAYLASLNAIKKSVATYDKYQTVLNDFGAWLEQHDAEQSDISSVQIVYYNQCVKARGAKNNTLRHYLIILRSFFKWCVAHKFYAEQPVLESDIPKQERVEYDLLTEQEVNRILSGEIPPYTKNPLRSRAIVFMFLLTGLRVSELANLKVGDIDFEKGGITLVGKGNKVRTTTLPNGALQALQAYLSEFNGADKNDLLFPSIGSNGKVKPFTRQNITKIVEGYVNRLLGHAYIGSHDLRHSFASMLITNDVPIANISNLLGHSNWETTAIYAQHLCPNRIAQEVNSVFDSLPIFQTAKA